MQEKTPRSWEREEQFYRLWLAPVLGRLPLKDVSPLHLELVKKNMADAGRAPRSIKYSRTVVRKVFNHARRLELFQGDSPPSKVKLPQPYNRCLRFLTQEEAISLLETLKQTSHNLHNMALLSMHTGMRAGREVLSLKKKPNDLVFPARNGTRRVQTSHAFR